MRKIFLIVVLSTALFSIVKAQGTSSGSDLYKGWSAYLNLGLTQPYTDLNRFQYFATWKQKNENRPGFTLGVRKMFSSVVGLQADISAGQILGDFRSKGLTGSLVSSNGNAEYAMYTQEVAQALWGTNKPKESVYFKTPYWQGAISAYIDLNNLGVSLFNARKGMLVKRRLAFYSYVGLGVISFDSKIYSLTTDSAYHKYLAGVSGKSMEAVVPVAIGAKYKINNKWNIGLEYKLNNVMSDKLDAFVNNSTGIYLRQGNYDKYGFASVALTYNFVGSNPSAENIEWVNPLTDKADQKVPTAAEILADADGDGVADLLDKEANTPAGCRVDGSGRALDTDGDGVIDCKDRERLSPAGYPVDANGVAQIPDTDGDGVLDNVDWEINSPAGCKVDTHGVCPKEDNKPVWGGAYNLPTVYFDEDKSLLKKDYYIELQRTALLLFANPTMKLDIVGNTDKHHTDDYNDKLGMRRAKNVADILIKQFSVPSDRINIKSNGKHILKSPNDGLNRRVDIIPAQ